MIKEKLSTRKKYDLESRTAQFGELVIESVRKIKPDHINKSIISQLVRASGSIGANYCEAVEAESKRDFIHKISISKKEIKETKHWLQLLVKANPDFRVSARELWKEAQELLLIFSKTLITSRFNKPT